MLERFEICIVHKMALYKYSSFPFLFLTVHEVYAGDFYFVATGFDGWT